MGTILNSLLEIHAPISLIIITICPSLYISNDPFKSIISQNIYRILEFKYILKDWFVFRILVLEPQKMFQFIRYHVIIHFRNQHEKYISWVKKKKKKSTSVCYSHFVLLSISKLCLDSLHTDVLNHQSFKFYPLHFHIYSLHVVI